MRLLDTDSDKKIDNVTLCLTKAEAAELRDALEQLLAKPDENHGHVNDYEAEKEVTVCLYGDGVKSDFNERVKKLISEDR